MSRVKPVQLNEVPSLQPYLDQGVKTMGFRSEDAMIMAHCPEILKACGGMVQAILGHGKINPGLKRLLGLMTSLSAGCRYCSAHTSYGASRLGIDQHQMEEIFDFENSKAFTPQERAAIRLAYKAGMTPNAAEDKDFEELRKYYAPDEIVEIVSTISMYSFLNRFNQTLDTTLEETPGTLFESLNVEV